jgi:hypothetical protein
MEFTMYQAVMIVGDLHLTPQTWRTRPEIQKDAYAALFHIVKTCIDNRWGLILAGDTFNSTSPTPEDVMMFRVAMEQMERAEMPVYAIQGNHDNTVPPWIVAASSHVQHVDGQVFEPVDGMKIAAFDFRHSAAIEEAVASIPADVHVCLLHQAARQVLDIPGAWNFDAEWMPKWVTHLFMGDIHLPGEFTWGPGTHGYYTGAMHSMTVAEPWQKSVLVASIKAGKIAVERINIPSREYMRIQVGETDASMLVDMIKTTGTADVFAPVIVVDHDGINGITDIVAKAKEERRISNVAQKDCCVWLVPRGHRAVNNSANNMPVESTTADIPATLAECTPDSALHTYVLQLLNSGPDAPKVIQGIRTEMLGVAASA